MELILNAAASLSSKFCRLWNGIQTFSFHGVKIYKFLRYIKFYTIILPCMQRFMFSSSFCHFSSVFSFVFRRMRCLIMTRFRRKVTLGAGANQPMNSGLTTELLAARVRAWKRVMNRLISFHSQPGISHLYFRPSRILRCLPPCAPSIPFLSDHATPCSHWKLAAANNSALC